MDYVTISSTGNATDFGDLLTQNKIRCGVLQFNARSFLGRAQRTDGTVNNTIQYVTIATTGNAADFGDMLSTEYDGGALASPTQRCSRSGNELSKRDSVRHNRLYRERDRFWRH
jgi:hypothetical protein